MSQAGHWYAIENRKDKHCALATDLNALYQNGSFQQTLSLPDQIGKGYWQKTSLNTMLEIMVCDIVLHEELSMSSTEQDDWMKICFCLGEGMQWLSTDTHRDYGIASGEVTAFGRAMTSSTCQFDPARRFHSLTLKLDVNKLMQAWPIASLEQQWARLTAHDSLYDNKKMTPLVRRILHEMLNCPYQAAVRRMYLEGKVLELLAVYIDEILREKDTLPREVTLSKTDLTSLWQAKQIVDANLLSPPSLAELSRQICLNEYKLKKGFKQLFGLPVHAYVIDQRLEQSRRLLEEGSVNVTYAASMAGFNNLGQFAEKFRKKYGVNPSAYLKSRGFRTV